MKEKYSNGMTDIYQSRVLATARQSKGKNIKFIKNVIDDKVEVEYCDGSASWLPWNEFIVREEYNHRKEI